MQTSYTKNYLKIYFWQALSLILNFSSLFIVIPFLSSDKNIYGIYSICISVTIFLSYADLGFLGSGQKFAAEHFSKGNYLKEIQTIGFTGFVLFCMLIIFSIFFLIFSHNPNIIISGITNKSELSISSSLLLILAIFTPFVFLQKISQIICSVRLEDYIFQRLNIISSLIKITSVLYFFANNKYKIVEYFLFNQLVNLSTSLIILYIIKKRYNYNISLLFKSIRFNKEVFSKTNKLAFATLYLTISWILFYELDSIVIGKLLGINKVSLFAIALSIMTILRSLLSIIFAPFSIRFNYFVAKDNFEGLQIFINKVVYLFAPIIIIPIVGVSILSKNIIYTWVGLDYSESVNFVRILVLSNIFAFISYPVGMLLIAINDQKKLYLISSLQPIIFWMGILYTISFWGIFSFVYFKFLVFFILAIFYCVYFCKFLSITIKEFFYVYITPILPSVILITLLSILSMIYLPIVKGKINLLIVSINISLIITTTLTFHFFFSKKWRNSILITLKNLYNDRKI